MAEMSARAVTEAALLRRARGGSSVERRFSTLGRADRPGRRASTSPSSEPRVGGDRGARTAVRPASAAVALRARTDAASTVLVTSDRARAGRATGCELSDDRRSVGAQLDGGVDGPGRGIRSRSQRRRDAVPVPPPGSITVQLGPNETGGRGPGAPVRCRGAASTIEPRETMEARPSKSWSGR